MTPLRHAGQEIASWFTPIALERGGGFASTLIATVTLIYPFLEMQFAIKSCSAKGCYTDWTTTRALGSYSTTTSSNTPASCEATCLGQGYTMAGVEYGSECFCANSITISSGGGSPVSAGDCNMACSGDSGQACGAGNRIFIYSYGEASSTTSAPTSTTTSSAPSSTWTSLGCYMDSNDRTLAAYTTTSNSMTNGLCQSTCNSRGYTYAGTEYGMPIPRRFALP